MVVTGALGHIGSYVVRDLGVQFPGAEIVMVDSLLTQRFPSLFNLPATARYRFIEGDVTSMELRPLLTGNSFLISLRVDPVLTIVRGKDRPFAGELSSVATQLSDAHASMLTRDR